MASDEMTLDRGATRAWIGYDFINSLLIINGSISFSRWITVDQHVGSSWYGFVYTLSTLVLLIASPVIGAAIDRRKNGRSLILYTSIALGTLAIALTGLGHNKEAYLRIGGTLVVFGLINFTYQLSLVPYNWLLPHIRGVSSSAAVTRYTGYGEAAGSIGSVVGALLGALLLGRWLGETPAGRLNLQAVMGCAFLALFAIDYLFLGRGTATVDVVDTSIDWANLVGEYWRDNWRMVRSTPHMMRYLVAFMLYADALLTVQLFLPIYLRERLLFGDGDTAKVFALALTVGALAGAAFGHVAPRRLRPVIISVLAMWLGVFVVLAVVRTAGPLLWTAIIIAGALFGVLWSASRAYLYQLATRATVGKGYGLYSVFERCASIIGPLVWGGVMLLPVDIRMRYAIAFTAMGVMIVIGAIALLVSPEPGYSE